MADDSGRFPDDDFDAKCVQAHRAYLAAGKNQSAAARSLGLDRGTFRNRLNRYFLRNLGGEVPVSVEPPMEIRERSETRNASGDLLCQSVKLARASSDEPFEVPAGHRVKGVSALLDADGNTRAAWVKTAEGERSHESIAEAARIAAERYAGPAAPIPPSPSIRAAADPALLNLHPLPDLHIGLKASPPRAQIEWNLRTAIETYRRLFRLLIERSPAAGTGIILGGGDLLHFDDPTLRTRQSFNQLDGSDPYAEVLSEAEMLMVYQVELALQKYPKVIVRVLEGNHDPDSAIAVAHFLKAWFRLEPRVEVDVDPSVFWFYRHGVVMLAATHGHEAKINQMPGIMAADRSEMWGKTKVRYAHGFHIHHATKSSGEEGGARWETHETPVPRDAYHQGRHYRSNRSLCTITYHAKRGETGRSIETLL